MEAQEIHGRQTYMNHLHGFRTALGERTGGLIDLNVSAFTETYGRYLDIVYASGNQSLAESLVSAFGRMLVKFQQKDNEASVQKLVNACAVALEQTIDLQKPLIGGIKRKNAIVPIVSLVISEAYAGQQKKNIENQLLECLQQSHSNEVESLPRVDPESTVIPQRVLKAPRESFFSSCYWGDAIRSFTVVEQIRIESAYRQWHETFGYYTDDMASISLATEGMIGLYIFCLQRNVALAHQLRDRFGSLHGTKPYKNKPVSKTVTHTEMNHLMETLHYAYFVADHLVYADEEKQNVFQTDFDDMIDSLCRQYFCIVYGTTNLAHRDTKLFDDMKSLLSLRRKTDITSGDFG